MIVYEINSGRPVSARDGVMPPMTTAIAPPAIPDGFVAVFDGAQWTLVPYEESAPASVAMQFHLTHNEFMDRFSAGEEQRYFALMDTGGGLPTNVFAALKRAQRRFENATYIDLTRQDTRDYLQALHDLGILDAPTQLATRVEEILEIKPLG